MIATLSAESITHASNDDMPAIHSLITACDIAVIGCAYFEGRSVFERWGAFEFDPNEDTLLRRNIEGQIVGYEGVLRFHPNGQIDVEGYVHPNYVERGIGTYLLRWAETRAREQISLVSTMQRHYLQSNAFGNDLLSRRLLEVEGYYTARHHRHMEIDMLETPVPAKWPTGISVRTFIPNKDEHATWTVWNEIFVEEWGYVEQSFEEWLDENEPDVDFDPSLWFWQWMTNKSLDCPVGHTIGKVKGGLITSVCVQLGANEG